VFEPIGRDLRVYCDGKEILASVLRESSSFKANLSQGGMASIIELPQSIEVMVKSILQDIQSDYIGIDFLYGHEDRFVFNEIEDVVGSRALYQLTDIDIADFYIAYIAGKIKQP
jgi:glutathione synthase/RimK-type ligase-like ATP-grasp enzyme